MGRGGIQESGTLSKSQDSVIQGGGVTSVLKVLGD